MSDPQPQPRPVPPTPEQLAAYADGELPAPTCVRVEAWLAENSDGRAELDELRAVTRLFQDALPPWPEESAWERVLDGVAAQLPPGPTGRPGPRPWLRRFVVGLAGCAALALAALTARSLWPTPAESRPAVRWDADEEGVLSVAAAAEVNILGMDPRDAERLALGVPLLGAFDLAAQNDIEVLDVQASRAGAMPSLFGDGAVPMIVVASNRE